MRHRILVCYDISADKRRNKAATLCESYGQRVQFSVFECPLDETRLARLKAELEETIHRDEDQVLFVTLGPESGDASLRIEAIGRPYTTRSRVVVV
jgi:CRISPR-associated protein Cas2